MARPVKPRRGLDREIGQLVRIRRVVQQDKISRAAWRESCEERLAELVRLFMSEDTRRRKVRE